MGSIRRGTFEDLVRRVFDPVATAYGFSLTPQPPADHIEQRRAVAVYETTPAKFTRRFPTSAAHWDFDDVGCVDLWIEANLAANRVDVHLEGEPIRELAVGSSTNHPANATEAKTRLEGALQDEAALLAVVLASRASE